MVNTFSDLEHGGQLQKASREFNVPLEDWLDLSTGVNPNPWPVPEIPKTIFSRLPERTETLDHLVESYYGFDPQKQAYLHGAGSQAFLPLLPQLFERKYQRKAAVLIAGTSYCEHRFAWERYGHQVTLIDFGCELELQSILAKNAKVDVLVVVNPNNPTGLLLSKAFLINIVEEFRRAGSWLVLDEAFIDTEPNFSLCGDSRLVEQDNLFILRSVGKFFGLAGIRSGFLFSNNKNIKELSELQGPWSVSGPASWLTERAFADTLWHEKTKLLLKRAADRLQCLIEECLPFVTSKTALFLSVWFGKNDLAQQVFESLAKQGVLTRVFPHAGGLRIGLPANEPEWERLESALAATVAVLENDIVEIAQLETS